MRHFFRRQAPSVASLPRRMGETAASCGLIATPGRAQRAGPRGCGTRPPAIALAAITARANHDRAMTASTGEHTGGLLHRRLRPMKRGLDPWECRWDTAEARRLCSCGGRSLRLGSANLLAWATLPSQRLATFLAHRARDVTQRALPPPTRPRRPSPPKAPRARLPLVTQLWATRCDGSAAANPPANRPRARPHALTNLIPPAASAAKLCPSPPAPHRCSAPVLSTPVGQFLEHKPGQFP